MPHKHYPNHTFRHNYVHLFKHIVACSIHTHTHTPSNTSTYHLHRSCALQRSLRHTVCTPMQQCTLIILPHVGRTIHTCRTRTYTRHMYEDARQYVARIHRCASETLSVWQCRIRVESKFRKTPSRPPSVQWCEANVPPPPCPLHALYVMRTLLLRTEITSHSRHIAYTTSLADSFWHVHSTQTLPKQHV